jgi:RNA recognition motif-containing protein
MDENFLIAACAQLGEYGVRNAKVIRQKFTGKTMGYGFLQFADEASAMETLTKLQGKVIPNTDPVSVRDSFCFPSIFVRSESEFNHVCVLCSR